MFTSFSKNPFHSTFYTFFLRAVAFSALFAVFRDALAVIVRVRMPGFVPGGGMGWGGGGGGGGVLGGANNVLVY